MTSADLEALLVDPTHVRRLFKSEEALSALAGSFSVGRVPFVHVTRIGGTEIRVKFVRTVKQVLNTKGREVPGKESFLSYIEVATMPAGKKGFLTTVNLNQEPWGTSRTKAEERMSVHLAELISIADALKIDLSAPTAWSTVYSQIH